MVMSGKMQTFIFTLDYLKPLKKSVPKCKNLFDYILSETEFEDCNWNIHSTWYSYSCKCTLLLSPEGCSISQKTVVSWEYLSWGE